MSKRKVKDAIDLETNEVIYFKSHAQSTFMSDGRTVEDAINDILINGGGGGNDTKEVYVGNSQPTDEGYELWIDEDEEDVFMIDDSMSDTSTNAVQNRVIKQYMDSAIGDIASILDVINGEVV